MSLSRLKNHTAVQAIISVVEKCLDGPDLTLVLVLGGDDFDRGADRKHARWRLRFT